MSTDGARGEVGLFPYAGFFTLAAVIALAVTTETMPTGLLPDMSTSLAVPGSDVGLLVTIYALTVALTTVPLIRLTRAWPRRLLLTAATVELGSSVILSAISPTFGILVATRVLGGLGHAVFWATIGAYPGHTVARQHVGRAVAIALGGSTVGFVFGLPLATVVGHFIGWRPTFAVVGAALVVSSTAIRRFAPHVASSASQPANSTRARPIAPVLVICALALVAMTGHYAFYTYIAVYAHDVLGVPAAAVGALLLTNGIAGALGLVCAGTLLAARPLVGIMVGLLLSCAALGLFAATPSVPWIALPAMFLWSMAFGALPPLMQTQLVKEAGVAFQDTGNAIYTATFSVGIGGGALVGALLYDVIGVGALPWTDVGLLLVSAALVLAASSRSLTARPPSTRPARTTP